MIKTKYIIISLIFSLCLPIQAQRVARLIYLNAPSDAPKNLTILQNEAEPTDLKVLTQNFSEPFKLEDNVDGIHLAPLGTEIDEEGQWKRFPKIKIPSTWQKAVIFLSHDANNNLFPLRGVSLNAEDSNYGEGDYMLINLSKAAVKGTVGKKDVQVNPNSKTIVKKPLQDKGNLDLSLNMRVPNVDKDLRLARNVFWYTGKTRSMVFIVPGVGKRYPTIHVTNLASFKLPETE